MSSDQSARLRIEDLSNEQLDYWMFKHACEVLGKSIKDSEFTIQYKAGQYHFSTDQALLTDLIVNYQINIQNLGGEWLASTTDNSAYGTTPTEAACRLVLKIAYGTHVAKTAS